MLVPPPSVIPEILSCIFSKLPSTSCISTIIMGLSSKAITPILSKTFKTSVERIAASLANASFETP